MAKGDRAPQEQSRPNQPGQSDPPDHSNAGGKDKEPEVSNDLPNDPSAKPDEESGEPEAQPKT